jgi:hypothetical protein
VTAARASRSGWSYSEREQRGKRRLEVWLSAECWARLEELVENDGGTRTEFVEGLIDAEHADWKAM